MIIFYIILNFCTTIPSETESDSSESNQESQYLTFTLNRILLNKKIYTYENTSFCNITLFKLNEDITETFKYHYNILRNKIFNNDTLSLKNCEKLYFGNIATSILYRLDGFLKENRIDMLDKISLIFFDYNFKKNSIKRQTHENLQIGKDKESMVFNETAKGNKKHKLNIKEENMLTNYEEEKDWLIKEDNNQLNIKEESIITTDREEDWLIKEENNKLNNEEEDMLTSDIECDLKKEETLLKKGKHLNFDIEEELHSRKKLKLIKKEENEDCIEKSNVKDKFKSNIKKNIFKNKKHLYVTKEEIKPFIKENNLRFKVLKIFNNLSLENNELVLYLSRTELNKAINNAKLFIYDILQKYKCRLFTYIEIDHLFLSNEIVEHEIFKKYLKDRKKIQKFIINIVTIIKNDVSEIIDEYKYVFWNYLLN